MNNFVKTMIHQMARSTGTVLTSRHFEILEFAADYHQKHKIGPLYHILKKRLGAAREEIDLLFPNGLQSIYTWAGIPIQSPRQGCKPIAHVEVKDLQEVYFDHNATTYIREEVKRGLLDFFKGNYGFGNPSSSTSLGRTAYGHIYDARVQIARTLKASPSEIYFTSGGSESNNTAIKGIAFKHLEKKGHIISSKIEHSSVLETLKWLETLGFEITLLDPGKDGIISPGDVTTALRKNTILVCLMMVNNEIGTINPIEEIGNICQTAGIPLMMDAVQGYGKIPINPKKTGISLLSLSGHKIYAPKGIGALYADQKIKLIPLIHGGEQEAGLRSGTENVASIMALGRAAALIHTEMKEEQDRLTRLRDAFLRNLKSHVPDFIINGSLEHRMPNNLNIGFPGVDSGALLLSLNHIGVYVSSGSACSSGSKEASHVIKALGIDTEHYGIVRFSFGLRNTEADVDYLFRYLPQILEQLKGGK
jgi:cysteine desulfurase